MTEMNQEKEDLKEKPMSFVTLVIITGLVGGIVFSALGYLAYIFNFTTIHPRVILEPWALGDWKKQWLGTVISIILMGCFSIVAALIYYAVLRRINNMWLGIAYGIGLFLLVFFILNPIFPGIRPINEINMNTLITTICLYALYGLFVGYTIAYEENEVRIRKNGDNGGEVAQT